MPKRIEDVLPNLARAREAAKLSLSEENGMIKVGDAHAVVVEQAKENADRARRTLEGLAPTVYTIIEESGLDPSEKAALLAMLGTEDARDLLSLVYCPAFERMGGVGRNKALRLFLDPDRHIFVLMMVQTLSYSSVSGVVIEELCEHWTGKTTLVRIQLSILAGTGVLQRHWYFYNSIPQAQFDEKAKRILDVFDTMSTVYEQSCLIELCCYSLHMFNRSASGEFLVDHLYSLATNGIDSVFMSNGVSKGWMLSSIMIECYDPGMVDQSTRGTCAPTSMQYVLCLQNPGEYVRIMNGLCSYEASVNMWNGDTLTRVNDAIPLDNTARSPSERVFQSSLMLYALGSYSNADPHNPGMNRDQEEKSLEALFGANFEVVSGGGKFWEDHGANILEKLHTRKSLDRTFASLKWGDGGHFVFITELKQGRVYYRNPWGPSIDPVGTMYYHPKRRLEDPESGLESMTETMFKNCVRAIIWPKV